MSRAFLTGTYFMFDKMEWEANRCKEIVVVRFIRLRQNTLQLAAGMNGGANAPKLEERRRVGFGEFRFDTPQLAAGSFICGTRSQVQGCFFLLTFTNPEP